MKSFLIAAGAALLLSTAAYAFDKDPAAELDTTAMHAGLAAKAADMAGAQMHLHHTLNCLVGPNGRGYDPNAGNPCQKNGDGLMPDTKSNVPRMIKLQEVEGHVRTGLAATDLAAAQKAGTDAQAALAEAKTAR